MTSIEIIVGLYTADT